MVKAKQGDIIILNFDPSSGTEIQKRRPAVVVSNETFNAASVLRLVCPITHTNRLLSIPIPTGAPVDGYILAQQVKALDLSARKFQTIGHMDEGTMAQLTNLLKLFF